MLDTHELYATWTRGFRLQQLAERCSTAFQSSFTATTLSWKGMATAGGRVCLHLSAINKTVFLGAGCFLVDLL